MLPKIKIFSFFSGCGFLDLGFEKAGFTICLVNEISSSFLNAYKFSREKMNIKPPQYGYFACTIDSFLSEQKEVLHKYINNEKKENNIIGFIGGPPCPDFSSGGKNRGKNGEHGKLSLSYIELIIKMKPDFFIFENVKGLWQTTEHRKFYDELKNKLHKVNYCTTDRLTNALEFGVPQDRDRILLVGIKKDILNQNQFDKDNRILDFPWTKYTLYNLEGIKKATWPTVNKFMGEVDENYPQDYTDLTIEQWFKRNEIDQHPNMGQYFKPSANNNKFKTIKEGDVSKKSYKRLHRWRYSPTAAYGNNEVHLHPYKERRLSAAEALAIQSLPKEFQLPQEMTLSDMFKTIGNGVPFLLSQGIAKTIYHYLKKTCEINDLETIIN